MAYTSTAQVQGLIGAFTISDTSVPSLTQVNSIIDSISDEIDSVLAGIGFTVPVSTPDYFTRRLALLNAYGVAAAVLKSAFPEARGPGENPAYAFWETRYRDGIKALRSEQDIPSTSAATGSGTPSSYFLRNPDEEEVLGDLAGASQFKIGDVW